MYIFYKTNCTICHQPAHGYLNLCPKWHNDKWMENYNGSKGEEEMGEWVWPEEDEDG